MAKKFSGESFALLMQGLAQGLHGVRQERARSEDDARQERRLQMEEQHYQGMREDRAASRSDLNRHRLEEERLRQESIDKVRQKSAIMDALGLGNTESERGIARQLVAHIGPLLDKGMDTESIVQSAFKSGSREYDLSTDQALREQVERLNKGRVGKKLPPVDVGNNRVQMTPELLDQLHAEDKLMGDYSSHLKRMDVETRQIQPLAFRLKNKSYPSGMDPQDLELAANVLREHPEELQRFGYQPKGARQGQAMAPQPQEDSRWSPQSRAGQAGMHVDDMLANASTPDAQGMMMQNPGANAFLQKHHELFSTDPKMRVTAWLDLHTAGFPVLPPTLDFAVHAPDGIPQLKPDVAQMIEQAFPGQGKSMAANQLLQQLATADQQLQQSQGRLQQQGGGGKLQGEPMGQGAGERALRPKPPASRPTAPAQTQGIVPQPRPSPNDRFLRR